MKDTTFEIKMSNGLVLEGTIIEGEISFDVTEDSTIIHLVTKGSPKKELPAKVVVEGWPSADSEKADTLETDVWQVPYEEAPPSCASDRTLYAPNFKPIVGMFSNKRSIDARAKILEMLYLAYPNTISCGRLSEEIYGEYTSTIFGHLRELINNGLIERVRCSEYALVWETEQAKEETGWL